MRTVTVTPTLARLIRDGNAVVVVHGIDYDHNGKYTFSALGVSDLDKTLPGDATAPALCGTLKPVPAANQQGARVTTYVASLAPIAVVTGRIGSRLVFFCHVGGRSVPLNASQQSADTVSGRVV